MRTSSSRSLWFALLFPVAAHAADGVQGSYTSVTFHLVAGENFLSLPFRPDTLALADVFNVASLPAGKSESDSTTLYTFGVTTNAQPRAIHYWLSDQGHWMSSAGGVADRDTLSSEEGFNIQLPRGAASRALVVSGRVAEGPVVQTLTGRAGEVCYHVMSWPFPCSVRVRDTGLVDAGFTGGVNVQQSDELRILDNSKGQGSTQTPKARIWLDAASKHFVFSAPRSGPAAEYEILPGDALIVVRKHAPDLTWTIKPPCHAQPSQ